MSDVNGHKSLAQIHLTANKDMSRASRILSPQPARTETTRDRPREGEAAGLTRGLDDAGLVGFGGVAMPLPVGEPLHHLAAGRRFSRALALRALFLSGVAAWKGVRRRDGGEVL